MRISEILENISKHGLEGILYNLDRPFSYKRERLLNEVKNATKGMLTKKVLFYLNASDLRKICKSKGLMVSGTKKQLERRLLKYDEKVGTLIGLARDIRKWKPKRAYRSEEGYTNDLARYLENKVGYTLLGGGPSRADLMIMPGIPIEIKYAPKLEKKGERNRAKGQMSDHLEHCGGKAILVICGYKKDEKQFDQLVRRIIPENSDSKCITIKK
jgi:hypothetical protein